ncbi:MAG TPA: C-GCAxxG-C-C family protein [Bacteroidales bacterium]|nr:C-GCAxxG-C-C family protein [Bacteroidales bacterium]
MDEYYQEIVEAAAHMATYNEENYHFCSQATLSALMQAFGMHDPDVLRSSTAFAGGVARHGNVCGAVSGCLMFLGLLAGRDDLEMKDQATRGMEYFSRFYDRFEERYGTTICREILNKLFGKEFDLTSEDQRDELHKIMVEVPEGCHNVCGEAARIAAEVAVEILEAGHPFANSIVGI